MAQVEIYKLRSTVSREIREHSVFDYMEKGTNPDPMNYVKEWAGEMHGTLPLTLSGQIMVEPPKGYHGGNLKYGDIAVVDGQPFYLDYLSGYKFVELDRFDADDVRMARHVQYGWFVDATDAEAISDNLVYICEEIGVPCGHLGEQKDTGVYNDQRPFLPGAADKNHSNFLHPQFLKGEEARALIELLTELSEAELWHDVADYLHKRAPITVRDLQDAREQYAPELLLPCALRPLSGYIPFDADKLELAYLAAKINGMNSEKRDTFYAVIETGRRCGSVAEIINLTENIGCFELQPGCSEDQYGDYLMGIEKDNTLEVFDRLNESKDEGERYFAQYVLRLEAHVDTKAFGRAAVEEENGVFTRHGYLTERDSDFRDVYHGPEDIPAEYRSTPSPAPEHEAKPIMVHDADLAALLFEMHAVGGDYMRDAKYNVKALAGKDDDFFVMMNAGMFMVTPASVLFHKDNKEYEKWMLVHKAPDIRAFVMSVTDRSGERLAGDLFEVDLSDLQDYIRENSFFFTHMDAEMRDGATRRFTLEEWDATDRHDRDQVKSMKKHYDPADEARLATYFSVLRRAARENRRPVPVSEFLSQISEPYMAQAISPQPDMFRVAPEAAKDILARNAADVYRLMPNGMEKLSPIDAIKVPLYSEYREFAVKAHDWAKIEKWARGVAGDVLRQAERGEREKSNRNGEVL
jgi:hypothetical protein